ncbi:hypothetical protein ACIA03_08960 [Nocardioides sp. NPDC051685]|uniref:hypothetical protein n=1 Tax=Nocardioides sp. NPDC051685 TaxID=3364334 RepID=UPI0037A86ADB
MNSKRSIHIGLAVSTGLTFVALAAQGGAVAAPEDPEAGIQAVRAWTAKYQDESAAIADGFVRTDDCVPNMGYHYVNFGRFDGRFEPSRPEALIYEDGPNGSRVLVAAEWLVVDADQDLGTNDDRPALFGHEFDGPMPGHFEGMPIHYDLHAYAWHANPDGSFATFNPDVTC